MAGPEILTELKQNLLDFVESAKTVHLSKLANKTWQDVSYGVPNVLSKFFSIYLFLQSVVSQLYLCLLYTDPIIAILKNATINHNDLGINRTSDYLCDFCHQLVLSLLQIP